jgi:hypothetical protein
MSYSPRHFSPFTLNSRLKVPAPLTPGHQTQSNIFDEDLNSQNIESNGESQKDTDTLYKSNSKEQLPEHSKDKKQSKELIVTPKIGAESSTPGVPRPPLFTSGTQNQSLITPSIVVPSNISNNDSDVKIVSDVPTKNVKLLPSNRQYDLMNSYNVQNHNQTNQPLYVTNNLSHHDACNSQIRAPFKINSSIQLEKFTGDSSVHPKTWWNKFQQWVDLYDIPQDKITKVITFQFADEAAVWYATLKPEITNNFQKFKEAFFKRFTEDDRILDMSILQILQGPSETVRQYLSRLFQNATNKDIPEQVLLAVGINGLRPEIRRIVMNKGTVKR